MMNLKCEIIADSISPMGVRLTSMEVEMPRFVLAEFNTHRMFSRNSASSRAIPVKKQIERVLDNPYMPVKWGKNRSGMQSHDLLDRRTVDLAKETWEYSSKVATEIAETLMDLKVHKQIANRVLEPYMIHTVLVTATDWDNFFGLRCHSDAQPDIRVVAERMENFYKNSRPTLVEANEWHLPYITDEEKEHFENDIYDTVCLVSAARCARLSYLNQEKKTTIDEDLKLAETLMENGHMSPFEHIATPFRDDMYSDIMKVENELGYSMSNRLYYNGNFREWIQYRKSILHENNYKTKLKFKNK